MTDKKKAARHGGSFQSNKRRHSTRTESQNLRLLAYLRNNPKGINRYEADAELTICQLAARVQDLEAKGCVFFVERETAPDLYGIAHNGLARYWLKSAPPALLEAINRSGVAR